MKMTLHACAWLAGALTIAGAAPVEAAGAKFDNATCATFFVGDWQSPQGKPTLNGRVKEMTFGADGAYRYREVDPDSGAVSGEATARWQAEPGSSSSRCTLTIDTEDAPRDIRVRNQKTFVWEGGKMVMERK